MKSNEEDLFILTSFIFLLLENHNRFLFLCPHSWTCLGKLHDEVAVRDSEMWLFMRFRKLVV